MRLSELLDCRVVDASGCDIGMVRDVRLVQNGPVTGGFGAGLRVEGLVVGPALAGTRLGYGRTAMRGPWLLAAPLRLLHRRVRFVPWNRVSELRGGTIHISGLGDDLGEPAPLRS
jgi:hypothetical protein